MKTENMGKPTHFEQLKPGEFFVTANEDGHPQFGLVAPSPDRQDAYAMIFNFRSKDGAEGPEIVDPVGTWSVWHLPDVILRPNLKNISLSFEDRSSVGELVVTEKGSYVVGLNKGSVVRIDVQTGLRRSSGPSPLATFRNWELVIPITGNDGWAVLFERTGKNP